MEQNLYSDLNNDGILDQIQIVLHAETHQPDNKFIWNLVGRLDKEQEDSKGKIDKKALVESEPKLCHALALSGIPAREEMFSTNVCGTIDERGEQKSVVNLDAINPLVVESLNGRRNTHDIIVALNNGMINRLHGSSGRRIWTTAGNRHADFPTWEEGSNHKALLSRVQSLSLIHI